jgi:hypothetical protein
MTDASEQANEALELARVISVLLAGRDQDVQGAALADLLAMWLAGHVIRGNPKKTADLREVMLDEHLKAVRSLIEPNYKSRVEPQLKANTQ